MLTHCADATAQGSGFLRLRDKSSNTGDKLRSAQARGDPRDDNPTAEQAAYHASLHFQPRFVSFIPLLGGLKDLSRTLQYGSDLPEVIQVVGGRQLDELRHGLAPEPVVHSRIMAVIDYLNRIQEK